MCKRSDIVDGIRQMAEAEAVTSGLAAEWWGDLAKYFAKVSQQAEQGHAEEDAKAEFKGIEAEYREYMGEKEPLPGSYRSAKSVVNKALRLGVTLVKANGHPKGKTEVEKECKALVDPKTNEDKAMDLLSTVSKLLDKMAEDGEDTSRVAETLQHLEIKAATVTKAKAA